MRPQSRFVGSDQVNMIGICGISGIGKTTLTKAIYNLMYIHFEGGCFCEDVRKQQDLTQVQMQIIDDIMKTRELKISNVSQGIMMIKKMMSSKPILLVLDDVDHRDQLKALSGSASWMNLLSSSVPKTVSQWVSELERLREHPNEEIQQVLRLSYDELNLQQQNILLDIAYTNMRVLVDKSLIKILANTFSSNMSLQMHDLIQAMAREIIHEESIMTGKQKRLWNSSLVYNVLSEKKVTLTEAVEVIVLSLEEFSQKVHIDANDFAQMKKLRILKIYQEDSVSEQKLELKGHNVIFSGNLYYLSNDLSMFHWHGCPFKYIPSDFYPENIVSIDLSYSNIKPFWTTPKCYRRLKVMKLRYCYNLTTTPDFSKITNLEVLDLEGCMNLVSIHPSVGMLKRLVVLNLTGCLKVNQLPEALGWIKSLTELHVDRTAITELPSFVSSLINLESLSFGGQGRIQPRWWTSITRPFGLSSKQQHPQISISLSGLHMLKYLNFSYCNLEQVPDNIGGLSSLRKLNLGGNSFTSLPGSLSQLSHLSELTLDGCKKLEVLPELPPNIWKFNASDCTSLREVSGSSKDEMRYNVLRNCPKLFKNVTIDGQGSKTQCLDSSITSQGFIHQLSGFLGYLGFQTNRCEFFRNAFDYLNIVYHGNSIPEWFTDRSTENHVKNFDGAALDRDYLIVLNENFFQNEVMGIQDSYMIWLHYRRSTWAWKEAKNFVTFCFENEDEDFEVKEMGVRLVYDEDVEQETDISMLQGLPTPIQHGGALSLYDGPYGTNWSW
ncbi:NB-ARC domains-containing protein [Tanacetum coccineum]